MTATETKSENASPVKPRMVAPTDMTEAFNQLRASQRIWGNLATHTRVSYFDRVRYAILDRQDEILDAVNSIRVDRDKADSLAAEILPTLSAIKYLEGHATNILKTRKSPAGMNPLWLFGMKHTVAREPHGIVMIIAPSNYPFFLVAVQMAQALVAGNAVILKPAPGCIGPLRILRELFVNAGLDSDLILITEDNHQAGIDAIQQGVDFVVLTGSIHAGRAVMQELAGHLTPSVMELSGSDAFIVADDANIAKAVDALIFGLTLNSGATCIAPRRVIVHEAIYDSFIEKLKPRLTDLPAATVADPAARIARELTEDAIKQGANALSPCAEVECNMHPVVLKDATTEMSLCRSDVFVPISCILKAKSNDALWEMANDCPYGLGATVFSESPYQACDIAEKLNTGVVVINDIIAPTAAPDTPFGGHGHSGFGHTQGREGLLAMTRVKVVHHRRYGMTPHLGPRMKNEETMLRLIAELTHAPTMGRRFQALMKLIRVDRSTN